MFYCPQSSCCYSVVSLGECDFLEALFYKIEQGWSVLLLACRDVIDTLMLETWESHCHKELWTKTGLVRCNTCRVLLTVGSVGDFDMIRLFEPILDIAVRQSI